MQRFSADGPTAGDAPIYERLIQERGDVPAQTRQFAERTLRDAERTVNFGAGPGPAPGRRPPLTLVQEPPETVPGPDGAQEPRDWFSARRPASGEWSRVEG